MDIINDTLWALENVEEVKKQVLDECAWLQEAGMRAFSTDEEAVEMWLRERFMSEARETIGLDLMEFLEVG